MDKPTLAQLTYIYFLVDDDMSLTPAGGFKDIIFISHSFDAMINKIELYEGFAERFRIVKLHIYTLETLDYDFYKDEWELIEDIRSKILILQELDSL